MSSPEELINGLNPQTPVFKDAPADTIPQDQAAPLIDEDRLKNRVLELLRNDIADKEQMGWVSKREWDIAAYYGLKNKAMMNWPWPNASAFPQPLTPTLLDTGHANVLGSMYSKADKLVTVRGIGVEDIRKAPQLEAILNWQLSNEVDMYSVQDANVFRTFLHGTGIVKVIQDFNKNTVRPTSIDIENIFVPLNAKGFTVDDTDHVFHMIPLSANDLEFRKNLKIGGKAVYKNLDAIPAGWREPNSQTSQQLNQLRDVATGTSMENKLSRDMYFMLEAYITYYPENSQRARELIVWMSPNGGTIHRVIENQDQIRPFADYHAYPNYGRFWSISLPEKIRNIQEKLDYADKQNTDALDRAISPALFIDDNSTFDPDIAQRVPGGMYAINPNARVQSEPQPVVERGFERQLDYMWELAERLTGLNDVIQGRRTTQGRTLGETQIRTSRADIRFSTIYDRFATGWKKTMNLIYYYDQRYMDQGKKVKVLGYADYQTIKELFPDGIGGSYDFDFSGSPVSEQEQERQNEIAFYTAQLATPKAMNDPATFWKISKKLSEAYGVRDYETVMSKPPEANIISAEEAIQRILSGQYDVQPRPGIDAENYIFEINLFMRSQGYQGAEPEAQQALQQLLRRAMVIRAATMQAKMDAMMIRQGPQAMGMGQPPGALPAPGQSPAPAEAAAA